MSLEEIAQRYTRTQEEAEQLARNWELPAYRTLLLATHTTAYLYNSARHLAISPPEEIDSRLKGCSLGRFTVMEEVIHADLDLIPLLVRAGADVNRITPIICGRPTSPLSAVVKKGRTDLVDVLLELGADINRGKQEDGTPLFLAIRNKDRTMIEMLIERGADVREKGLMEEALKHHRGLDAVAILFAYGADPRDISSEEFTWKPLEDMLGFLDITGYALNAPCHEANSIISWAAFWYYHYKRQKREGEAAEVEEKIRALLARGADPELAGDRAEQLRQDFL